jgi:hypothetical protein
MRVLLLAVSQFEGSVPPWLEHVQQHIPNVTWVDFCGLPRNQHTCFYFTLVKCPCVATGYKYFNNFTSIVLNIHLTIKIYELGVSYTPRTPLLNLELRASRQRVHISIAPRANGCIA